MPISHLEHFLIVSNSYEETCAWYINNLGMQEGPHPDFGPDVEVTWLYLGDKDVVHIVPPVKMKRQSPARLLISQSRISPKEGAQSIILPFGPQEGLK